MKNVAMVVFFSALTGLVVWFAMGWEPEEKSVDKGSNDSRIPSTETDFVKKTTELKMRRDRVKKGIVRLERQKAENVQYLKDKGIRKVADAKDDPDIRIIMKNIQEWNIMIKKRNSEVELIDGAIARLEGMLSKIRRDNLEKSVGLTEDQLVDLMAIQSKLDDELGLNDNDLFDEMELEKEIDQELNDNGSD